MRDSSLPLKGRALKTLLAGCSKRSQRRMSEMECWSKGVLDYWVLNASLHYSTTPILHYSSLSRWSEEIEHNEAYKSFSAACQRVEPGVGLVVLVKGLSFTSHSGEKLR